MFFAYLHQPGGCDYTIGCGNLLVKLEADTIESAKKELIDTIKESYTGDYALEEVTFISGETIPFDVSSVYEELESEKEEQKRVNDEQHEREEFERLKKKYG